MHHGVVGREVQGPEVGGHRSVEDPSLLQHVAQVDVGVQEVRVQRHRLGGKNFDLINDFN